MLKRIILISLAVVVCASWSEATESDFNKPTWNK